MCKITFSHIIQESSLRKGLFQLIDQNGPFEKYQKDNLSDGSSENSCESFEDVRKRMDEEMQGEILNWFNGKSILSGNPEDLIYKHI